jgi:hypothetical protein
MLENLSLWQNCCLYHRLSFIKYLLPSLPRGQLIASRRQFINKLPKIFLYFISKIDPKYVCIMKIISALATAPTMSEEEVDNSLIANRICNLLPSMKWIILRFNPSVLLYNKSTKKLLIITPKIKCQRRSRIFAGSQTSTFQ